ncbi:hypothetical protein HNR56_003233 [Roseospira marina]|nr:hypothetical protein [Roseospira marina]MBB5088524.1 hypothetical protein [Roseospira marina]
MKAIELLQKAEEQTMNIRSGMENAHPEYGKNGQDR